MTAIQPSRPMRRRLSLRTSIIIASVILALISFSIPGVRRFIANPTGQAAAIGIDQVLVRGDAFQGHVFEPPVIQVAVGTSVTWTFADRGANGTAEADPHNVVGSGFASPVLTTETWQHTFTNVGSFTYVCTLHPNMKGRVEVVQ